MRILLSILFSLYFVSIGFSQNTLMEGLDDATAIDASLTHLFILETGKDRFIKLDFDGIILDSLGGPGRGDYQFDMPVDINVSNGLKIYVSDQGNARVQVYDRRNQYLSSLAASSGNPTIEPAEVEITDFGEVILYDKRSRDVKIFDEFGQQRPRFNFPPEVEEVNQMQLIDGKLFILDFKASVIHELEANGRYRSFYPADQVDSFTFHDGNLCIAEWKGIRFFDQDKYLFETNGEPVQDMVYVKGKGLFVLFKDRLVLIEA